MDDLTRPVCTRHPGYDGTEHELWEECANCRSVETWVKSKAQVSDDTNPKDRVGDRKPPLHLIPAASLIRLSKVMELGAKKYGAMNWRSKKVRYTVYASAAMRHILSATDGEDIDPESNQLHLGHAMACMAILIDAIETGNLIDDRPTKGVAAALIQQLTEKETK